MALSSSARRLRELGGPWIDKEMGLLDRLSLLERHQWNETEEALERHSSCAGG